MQRRKYGTGSITKKGYIRINGTMAHRRVWRKHNGPVPVGYFIYHIDGDKQNNDISNLVLVTALEHKRIHSGCELRNGEWWKPCKKCGEIKRIDKENWYISKEGWPQYGRCKKCHIRIVVEDKKRRRMAARS